MHLTSFSLGVTMERRESEEFLPIKRYQLWFHTEMLRMAAYTLPPCPDVPPELVTAIVEDAARDADHVGLFLRTIGLEGSPHCPIHLPAAFLLDLGAALRLLEWERRGLQVHLEVGLPSAKQALRDVFQAFAAPSGPAVAPARSLTYRVMILFVERFAWNARVELDADITLDEPEEDQLLEALADFLWEHRPS